MKTCELCRKEFEDDYDFVFSTNGAGVTKIICKECEQKVAASRHENPTNDKLIIAQTKSASSWIDLMRIIAWISFGGIIIAGIAIGAMIGVTGEGFLAFIIFIGSIILAFVSIAAEMIFLDMAADMRRIRELLERNEKSFK